VADSRPIELLQLFGSARAEEREIAWDALVAAHHRLLLHVARASARDHDAAMDAYAYVLERLREDDYRRLRSFDPTGRASFSTWLTVVVRRLCVDLVRQRYGRGGRADTDEEARRTRRRLVDLTAEELDVSNVADVSSEGPEAAIDAETMRLALTKALAELEPRDRLLLALRFEDDLSAERIAGALDMPTPFHVYRRLTRVLESLRKRLQQHRNHGPPT
jgi:RNA polymerase sigma factor (sigma-70 family)